VKPHRPPSPQLRWSATYQERETKRRLRFETDSECRHAGRGGLSGIDVPLQNIADDFRNPLARCDPRQTILVKPMANWELTRRFSATPRCSAVWKVSNCKSQSSRGGGGGLRPQPNSPGGARQSSFEPRAVGRRQRFGTKRNPETCRGRRRVIVIIVVGAMRWARPPQPL
jgi:hypothetical protein